MGGGRVEEERKGDEEGESGKWGRMRVDKEGVAKKG